MSKARSLITLGAIFLPAEAVLLPSQARPWTAAEDAVVGSPIGAVSVPEASSASALSSSAARVLFLKPSTQRSSAVEALRCPLLRADAVPPRQLWTLLS